MRSFPCLAQSTIAALAITAFSCGPAPQSPPTEGSSSSSSSSSSDDGDASTTSIADDGSSSSEGESSTGQPPAPEPSCNDISCGIECSVPAERMDSRGNACECEAPTSLEGIFDCDLPSVCGEFDQLCQIQGLRWGIVGSYPQELQIPDSGGFFGSLEVLEPGLAHRRVTENDEFQCCNGELSEGLSRGDYPRQLPPPTDPGWMDCFAKSPTGDEFIDCSGWAMSADLGSCTDGPIEECPAPPPPPRPGAPCEETCPMANDGVCDEPSGSGLCPAGCDPIDCTCVEDVPGQCDETTEGGPCPIGSDPDFCSPFG